MHGSFCPRRPRSTTNPGELNNRPVAIDIFRGVTKKTIAIFRGIQKIPIPPSWLRACCTMNQKTV